MEGTGYRGPWGEKKALARYLSVLILKAPNKKRRAWRGKNLYLVIANVNFQVPMRKSTRELGVGGGRVVTEVG